MRIIFMGSGDVAVPVLRALLAARHDVVGVFTQPPRPAGRKGRPRPTPIALTADSLGVSVIQCPDVNADAAVGQAAALTADVICVVEFGQFIRRPMRAVARLEAFNMHASLLPALRGAAPVNWAIINGMTVTGVTTFRLVDEMDAGPVYLTRETPIAPDERADELKARLAALGAQGVLETLNMIAAGAEPAEQDHSRATFAPKLTKADGVIDFSADAVTIRNRIHGAWPWPGGQAVLHRAGRKDCPVTIAAAEVLESDAPPGHPGELDDALNVRTGQGALRIRQIKPTGKRLMDWADFVNGYRVAPGDQFARKAAANG